MTLTPEARNQLKEILKKRKRLAILKNYLLGNPVQSSRPISLKRYLQIHLRGTLKRVMKPLLRTKDDYPIYRIPQIQVLIDNPPEDPQDYLPRGTSEEEALSLLVDPKTGLPAYLPNNPRAAQVLKTILDKELPLSELEDRKSLPLDHQIEYALDLLLNTKDTILSRL